MGTIADKLQKLLSTKEAIKQAIIQKGISVSDSDTFSSYASKIESIETGGGVGELIEKTITQNGTYNASDDNADGYSKVVVDVLSSGDASLEIRDCRSLFRDTARLDIYDEITKFINKPINLQYAFYQTSASSLYKSIDLSKMGDFSEVTTADRMFYNCNYITDITGISNLTNCTNVEWMFRGCSTLKSMDLTGIDLSNVTDAAYMFYNCRRMTTVGDIYMPKVTDVSYMFQECYDLESINLPLLFSGGKIENMSYFLYYTNFTSLDFSECNMSKVTNIASAFARMESLESIVGLDLSGIMNTNNMNFMGSYESKKLKTIRFKEGSTLGKPTISSNIILNLARLTALTADDIAAMMETLPINDTGYTRTIKIYTRIYETLTDEQKAVITDKGYTLTYAVS